MVDGQRVRVPAWERDRSRTPTPTGGRPSSVDGEDGGASDASDLDSLPDLVSVAASDSELDSVSSDDTTTYMPAHSTSALQPMDAGFAAWMAAFPPWTWRQLLHVDIAMLFDLHSHVDVDETGR